MRNKLGAVMSLGILISSGGAAFADDSYIAAIQKWRAHEAEHLLGPEGPFTAVARFLPSKGISSIGRDPSNTIVLPVKAAPARVGMIDWVEDKAVFELVPGVKASVQGKTVEKVEISQPVEVAVGAMTLRFAFRNSALRLSVSDPNSDRRHQAKPQVWFPIDPKYRITADWVPLTEAKTVRIADNDGGSREWKVPGFATFQWEGASIKLEPILSPDGKVMTFLFRDLTAGKETYGAGRFLDADLPKDNKVILDFNKAYNPTCAYNELYVCPIPPKENRLVTRIAAGELNYPHPGHGE